MYSAICLRALEKFPSEKPRLTYGLDTMPQKQPPRKRDWVRCGKLKKFKSIRSRRSAPTMQVTNPLVIVRALFFKSSEQMTGHSLAVATYAINDSIPTLKERPPKITTGSVKFP